MLLSLIPGRSSRSRIRSPLLLSISLLSPSSMSSGVVLLVVLVRRVCGRRRARHAQQQIVASRQQLCDERPHHRLAPGARANRGLDRFCRCSLWWHGCGTAGTARFGLIYTLCWGCALCCIRPDPCGRHVRIRRRFCSAGRLILWVHRSTIFHSGSAGIRSAGIRCISLWGHGCRMVGRFCRTRRFCRRSSTIFHSGFDPCDRCIRCIGRRWGYPLCIDPGRIICAGRIIHTLLRIDLGRRWPSSRSGRRFCTSTSTSTSLARSSSLIRHAKPREHPRSLAVYKRVGLFSTGDTLAAAARENEDCLSRCKATAPHLSHPSA
jgi:hypothetical protein